MSYVNTNNLFGNVIGTSFNGLVRIPALLASATAVIIAGELGIRTLSAVVSAVGFKPTGDGYIGKVSTLVETNLRPYGRTNANEEAPSKWTYEVKTLELIQKLFVVTVAGVLLNELVRVLAGGVPPVYNHVLTILGPYRLNSGSYLEGVKETYGLVRGALGV